MTDEEAAIQLVRSGALTIDQCMAQHLNGALRPLPGQGVKVLIVGTVMPFSDEVATFHEAISHELVRRGVAAYA